MPLEQQSTVTISVANSINAEAFENLKADVLQMKKDGARSIGIEVSAESACAPDSAGYFIHFVDFLRSLKLRTFVLAASENVEKLLSRILIHNGVQFASNQSELVRLSKRVV